jgi:alpha-tubulin suppressor-like RCC1 family protein
MRLAVAGAALALLMMLSAAAASGASEVVAWGGVDFTNGALGDGTTTTSWVPVGVTGLSHVTRLSIANENAVALMSDGTVMTWGWNAFGQMGIGTSEGPEHCPTGPCSTHPVAVEGLSGVTAIATGIDHDVALLSDGRVMNWGINEYGQLGDGTIVSGSDTPVEVSGLEHVIGIAAGGNMAAAVLEDGTVKVWGTDGSGPQTCFNSVRCAPTPVSVPGLKNVTALAAGGAHYLALLSNGTVMAWGLNSEGQLGNGTTVSSEVPVPVSGLSNVRAIAAGGAHSLALLSDGTVMAWGSGGAGQLGDGATANSDVPVAVTGLSDASSIAAGGSTSMAVLDGGAIRVWGSNTGVGGTPPLPAGSDTAVSPIGLKEGTGVAAGDPVNLAIAPGPTPPEFGTCVKLSGPNPFHNSVCDSTPTGGLYRWTPGVSKSGITFSGGEVTLQTAAKAKVACSAVTGTGRYEGTKSATGIALTLTGCTLAGQKCTSIGAAEGEVVTAPLSGSLGWITDTGELKTSKAGLDLAPENALEAVMAFDCGATEVEVTGSFIARINIDAKRESLPLVVSSRLSAQIPEHLEGQPNDVLETSLSGGPLEHSGLTIKELKQTNEEAVEVNGFV